MATIVENQEHARGCEGDPEALSSFTTEPTSRQLPGEDSASGNSHDASSQKKIAVDDVDDDIPTDKDIDPLRDLEGFLTTDTSRLNLKWEPSVDGKNSKITVGVNTYLPLGERGCFSLEIPKQELPQSSSSSSPSSPSSPSSSSSITPPHSSLSYPKELQRRAASAREFLFQLVSKIVLLSPWIRQLDLEGFGRCSKLHRGKDLVTQTTTETLDIEDVFEAFAREESSPWRRGILVVLRTWNCDMNSHKGNHSFDLAEHEFPEGLEEVYVHNPKRSVLSSSIFKIASRTTKLNRIYVFDGYDNYDNDNDGDADSTNQNKNLHRFNGSRLTQSSVDAICEVLSSTNQFLEMNQLPFRELLQLTETEFCKILEATTKTPKALADNPFRTTCLRFPIVPPKMLSGLTILATRSETLRFYLLWKRSLEILRNPQKKGLSPRILEKCQKQKSAKRWVPYSRMDLLFAMLQDSLEGLVEAPKPVGQHWQQ